MLKRSGFRGYFAHFFLTIIQNLSREIFTFCKTKPTFKPHKLTVVKTTDYLGDKAIMIRVFGIPVR